MEKKSIEIPINEIEWCKEKYAVGNSFLPLFSFNLLRSYEHSCNLNEYEKRRAEELSISSGVLCKYTGFVGMTKNPFNMRELRQMKCTIGQSLYCGLCPIEHNSALFHREARSLRREGFQKGKTKQYIFYSILTVIIIVLIYFMISLLHKMKSK